MRGPRLPEFPYPCERPCLCDQPFCSYCGPILRALYPSCGRCNGRGGLQQTGEPILPGQHPTMACPDCRGTGIEPCRCVYPDKCFCTKETRMKNAVQQLVEASHALIDSLDFHTAHEQALVIDDVRTAIARVDGTPLTTQQLDTEEVEPTPAPRHDPVRLLVLAGLAVGDTRPVVAVADDESTVDVDCTDWDERTRYVRQTWGSDYEWREVVVLVPVEPLLAALERVEVQAEVQP